MWLRSRGRPLCECMNKPSTFHISTMIQATEQRRIIASTSSHTSTTPGTVRQATPQLRHCPVVVRRSNRYWSLARIALASQAASRLSSTSSGSCRTPSSRFHGPSTARCDCPGSAGPSSTNGLTARRPVRRKGTTDMLYVAACLQHIIGFRLCYRLSLCSPRDSCPVHMPKCRT